MKIVTNYVYPPIPIRQFDWSAIDDDTYDGEGCLIGYGATEQEAIDDLLDKMNDDGLSDAEQKAQAARCGCRGSDDYCACQNVPDATTKAERRAVALSSRDSR
ncbi:MAG: hypothetical protein WC213_00185 [Arenimonas sp.]|jgi:hypothetical protein